MFSLADNTFLVTTPDRRQLVFLEKSSGLLRGLLTDEAGTVIQASQLSDLRLWLHLRDDTTLPAGGINGVSNTSILNDGVRGSIGNSKAITGATVNTAEDDFRGRIRLTIPAHGYSNGDLIGVRGVRGLRGANGDWLITGIDANTIELIGSSGSGAYSSGGTATKGLHLQLQPGDNAIVQSPAPAIGATEWHEAYMLATFSGKAAPVLFHYQVKNLGKTS